jgi:hypothetical protein
MKLKYLLSITLTWIGFLLSFLPSTYFLFLSREILGITASQGMKDPERLSEAIGSIINFSYLYPVLNFGGLVLIIGGVYLYVRTGLVPPRL